VVVGKQYWDEQHLQSLGQRAATKVAVAVTVAIKFNILEIDQIITLVDLKFF
jgi:hypothetical protein